MTKEEGPIRALVVDDQPDAAESLSRLLEMMGCAAMFVTDPREAIDAAESINPEIVFLDIGMPHIDGYKLADMFRGRYGARVVLVAVTGYNDGVHHQNAREADFDADLQKPISVTQVESLLAAVRS
jgi:CheY-like chemotaxis protein